MTIDQLKRALVEVRGICVDTLCVDCPFRKKNEYTGFPVCPLGVATRAFESHYPCQWDIDDWEGDSE